MRQEPNTILPLALAFLVGCGSAIYGCKSRGFNDRADESDAFTAAMRNGSEKRFEVLVHSTIDTDALRIEPKGGTSDPRPWRVRLLGVDAPEPNRGSESGGQEPWGDMAAQALTAISSAGTGKPVLLRSHGMDAFGRHLGRVTADGVDVGLALVKIGLAWPYPDCFGNSNCAPSALAKDGAMEIMAACEEAAAAGKGVHNRTKGLKETAYEFRSRVRKETPIAFVGDLRAHTFVPVARMAEIPLCRRVFFTTPGAGGEPLDEAKPNHPRKHGYTPAR